MDLFNDSSVNNNDKATNISDNCITVTDNDTQRNLTDCIICNNTLPMAVSVIQVIIGIVVTMANFVTIIALARCRGVKKILRMLLINQSVTDTMFGIVYIYHSVVVYTIWHNIPECIFRYSALSLSSAVSLQIITMLSLERIVAIKFPYRYHELSNKSIMTLAGALCWIGPVVITTCGFVFAETDIYECNFLLLASPTTLTVFGIPSLCLILVIIACNGYLFKAAREHIKKIIPTFIGIEKYKQGIKMNLKATLTSASIIVPFLVLNAPQYIFFVVLSVLPSLRYRLEILYVMNLLSSLVMFNSVVNPIIYAWRMKELRAQLIRLLCSETFYRVRNTPKP